MKIVTVFCVHELVMENKCNNMHGERIKTVNTLHVLDSLSAHHPEFKTVHTASGICQTDTATCLVAGTRWNSTEFISFPLASRQQYLSDIYLTVYVQS